MGKSMRRWRCAAMPMVTIIAILVPLLTSGLGTLQAHANEETPPPPSPPVTTAATSNRSIDSIADMRTTGVEDAALHPPQALRLTKEEGTGAHVSSGPDFSVSPAEDPAELLSADNPDGRNKRRRMGRKRKRRPLQDDYWQDRPNDDADTMMTYADGSQAAQNPERKRTHSRWENEHRPVRPDRWVNNPYTDAVDPHQPTADTPSSLRRPYNAGSKQRQNFPPIDVNRQRRIPRPEATQPPALTGHKAYRKPYSQARRSEEDEGETSSEAGKAADLKALLKKSDGLSLSEILQQRNISLQDLIKGKQLALAALTQSPLELTTHSTTFDTDNDMTTTSPTLSSVRFRVHEDGTRTPEALAVAASTVADMATSASTPSTTVTAAASASAFSSLATNVLDDEANSVDDIITLENLSDRNGNVAISPTVEIKQLTLNPVLPVLKDERSRPIKGVASRIRPDLSNTHIRTEDIFAASKKRAQTAKLSATAESWRSAPVVTTTTTTTTTTTQFTPTAREKWTPSASLVERREQFLLKLQNQSKLKIPTAVNDGPVTAGSIKDELSTAHKSDEFSLSETEPYMEVSSERHLLRVPKQKTRIAIRPKIKSTTPDVGLNLADIELQEDANNHAKQLDQAVPELNIIERFTSYGGNTENPPEGQQSDQSTEPQPQELNETDLMERIHQNTQRSFTDSLEDLYRDVTESNPSLFNDLSPMVNSEDKREILELMEDHRVGSRLAKVLAQRNMTLEQLLEHRRRGSSQLHLAEIINSKVKPIDDKMDIVTAFEHFPRFNIGNLRSIRPDEIKLDSQGFSYFTSIINLRPSEDMVKGARALQERVHRIPTPNRNSPADWKSMPANHKLDDDRFLGNGGPKGKLIVPSRMSADADTTYDSGMRDELEQGSDILDLELSGHGFQHRSSVTIESASIPVGVRSAIVASAAIVGVSLLIFIVIFVVCRVRQKRRNKLNYTENFKMAKGRLPAMRGEGIKTISGQSPCDGSEPVIYTTHRVGTSGKLNTMDPNSSDVHDYLWDGSMRTPFQ